MVETIWNIILIAAIGLLWISSEPTYLLREWICKKIYGCNFERTMLWRLLECTMCSTFWIYILYKLLSDFSIQIGEAAVCSILAELIDRRLKKGI